MNPILTSIEDELKQLANSIKTTVPNNEPLSNALGVFNNPGITRDEIVGAVETAMALVTGCESADLSTVGILIADYQRRLSFLRTSTVPQIWSGNGGQAVSAILITLDGLKTALEKVLPKSEDLAQEVAKERANVKLAATRLRSLEARIADLSPRSQALDAMVERIETANAAADQLPVDLESLREAQKTIAAILAAVTSDRASIGSLAADANTDKTTLSGKVKEAEDIVARCSAAYAASTSHGLAAAFAERSAALATSMWVWVFGLIVALGLGSWIGTTQLRNFSDVIKQPDTNSTVAAINLILALLSVGATVWFSWLATKQIGQRFRLAEDYAFKASVSRAYEGYRREAANIDEAFVARLFSSALSRLDEQPLRLVETTTHGSPWHELASSDVIRKATEVVPDFANSVMRLAKDGLAALKPASKAVDIAKSAGNIE